MILGPGADIFEQIANGDGRPGRSGRARRLEQLRRRGSASSWDPWGDGRLAIRGGYGIAYERLFNNSITNIRFNPPFYSFAVANPANVASQAGVPIAYGPMNPDGTRPQRADHDHRRQPQYRRPARPEHRRATSSAGIRRSARHSSRCACPIPNTKDAFTHNWFVGAQTELMWDLVLEANYVGNVGRNFGRLVDYNTVRGDLFDGRLNRLNPAFGGINFRAMLARSGIPRRCSSS